MTPSTASQQTSPPRLLSFLNELRAGKIYYELHQRREDAIMVEIAVPGSRWEVEFLSDGSVEVEVFRSDGRLFDESALAELISLHSDADAEPQQVPDEPQDPAPVPTPAAGRKLDFDEVYWDVVAAHLGTPLHHRIGRQRKIYESQGGEAAVLGRVNIGRPVVPSVTEYWFNVEDQHATILEQYKRAFVAFACGSPDAILLTPFDVMKPLLPELSRTDRLRIVQYNVRIQREGHRYLLLLPGGDTREWQQFLIRHKDPKAAIL
jgi:hypothetical protein